MIDVILSGTKGTRIPLSHSLLHQLCQRRQNANATGNDSAPKIIINDTINLFFNRNQNFAIF